MSESTGKAVFLSYASQDAEAAKRIGEVLRAAGAEVWFDQSELRGGDAWDRKIRRQIKECALFVPVISEKTNTRAEGYFRLEWLLAVERSRLMADDQPFLLPVVIDATPDATARVPDRFRDVQWTRLRGGETPPEFCARVKMLLGEADETRPAAERLPVPREAESRSAPKVDRRVPAAAWVGAVALAGLAAFLAFRPTPKATPAPALSQPAVSLSNLSKGPPTSEKSPAAPADSPAPRLGLKSIAVLPFDNLSEDKDANAFFADGMHDDVIQNLLFIRELRLVPRTTAMTYRDTKKTNREIADELGVAYLLTGTVRRADKKVRITATFLHARTDEPLWSRRYDKDLTDVFAIQVELAQAIAGELKAVLSPQEKRLLERRPTENTAAYDLFLRAREMRNANYSGKTGTAEALLQAAVELDPKFAIAWSELAYVRSVRYYFNYDHTAESLRKAKVAIEISVRLSPEDPEVILNRGFFAALAQFNLPLATELFERAARLQPDSVVPRYGLAGVQRLSGKFKESLEGLREVAKRDSGNVDYALQVYLLTRAARRWEEAAVALRRSDELRQIPPNRRALRLATLAFHDSGSTREMEELLSSFGNEPANDTERIEVRRSLALMHGSLADFIRDAPALLPEAENLNQILPVAAALATQGKAREVQALLAKAPAMLRARIEREPENAHLWSDLGMVEALLGHKAEALRGALKAVELLPDPPHVYWGPIHRVDLAFVRAWTGDKETALAEYTRLLRTPLPQSGPSRNAPTLNIHVMRHHPFYFPLRGDPRFEALLNDPKNNAPLF